MKNFLLRLQALAFLSGRYIDIYMAAVVVCIIALFILPVPPWLLDSLIAVNLTAATVLLMMSLYVNNVLAFSTFPSILLITTLFRLALNITSTRLILVDGYAGQIIYTFGSFVVGGNFVVGCVIFLILLVVQFIVITKGAERVAEVAARFTLDAMPGKQMSIDADMRAGVMDIREAQKRRSTLERESQLFGAMDGAMKFVKGDAIASLIIVAVNLIAGLTIGIVQKGMSPGKAVETYSILTIGDGMVSQIPALLICITAGIIVTRVGSDEDSGLGTDIVHQVLAVPKALMIGGTVLFAFALIPGFPAPQFLALATGVLGTGYMLYRASAPAASKRGAGKGGDGPGGAGFGGKRDGKETEGDDRFSVTVPVLLEADAALQESLDVSALNDELVQVKKALYLDLGVPFPGIHLRFNSSLSKGRYQILLQEVPMAEGTLQAEKLYVRETDEHLSVFRIPHEKVDKPLDQQEAWWVPATEQKRLVQMGVAFLEPVKLASFHISLILRRYSADFVGLQETRSLLTSMEQEYGEITREVQRVLPAQKIAEVLQRLVQEDISIRNLRVIFQALIEWGGKEKDSVLLTEYVRVALKRYISFKFSGGQNILVAYLLDPGAEETLRKAIRQTSSGSFLALEPAAAKRFVDEIKSKASARPDAERRPVLLTSMDIRRYTRKLIEMDLPDLAVLSHQELTEDLNVQPIGRISLN